MRAALDAVPDPVNGLLIYRGRGRGRTRDSGAGATRARARLGRASRAGPGRRQPASAVALPEREADEYLDLTGAAPWDLAAAETVGRLSA